MKFNKKLDVDDYSSRNGQSIKYIVLHDTGNETDSDEGNLNYFNNGQRYASAHYFVDDDSYSQLVEEWNSAWHCGDGYGKYGITNENSIGIEMCRVNNTVTPSTEENTIWLVKKLMQKYAIPLERVVRHYDASRKNCPSSFSGNNWSRWNSFKNKLVENKEEEIDMIPTWEKNLYVDNGVYDSSLRGKDCYLRVDADIYSDIEGAKPIKTLRAGQKLKIYSIDKGMVSFSRDYVYCTGYIRINKVDIPYSAPTKVVEVEKPLNLTKEICLEYLEKNLK